ncbi:selenocysteine-specific translation elongation factor [Rhizobacter sp. J219]|uniref:selenocysteine-specific translation elongation factor n=1 Tax=Rhizobacter sp. J219 TaxID=2898430 RepID=UPI002151D26A|nr:selenocysteine-specific translation elongation factor [Rhizobacter sp. J219]MCR5885598.1 selenocysteine-specific translation elongation factor [Rhizobacter sp. J219]
MIVGTAGHIDHGKTTLVRALTGVDTDRLPEEKRRGISIELGYAFLDAPQVEERIGFIDVPGHERLVHTMLAGATGIDYGLLLVAADDGVMPQTREHLAVLSLLGVSRGAVAVTKIDRTEGTRVAVVQDEVAALLADSSLAGAPVLPVSAHTGAGLADLRGLLFEAARQTAQREVAGASFRLAIDRVFTLAGVGTVVTGTVHAGRVHVGDELVITPSPKGLHARVRSLHAQNQVVTQAHAGQRCAVALVGVAKDDIVRGQWLTAPHGALDTQRLDADLTLWHDEPRPLRSGTPVHVHLGACDVMGTVAVLDRSDLQDALAPGVRGRVQIVLAQPIGAWRGDRVVLRDNSASRTLAGGVVLDPQAPARYRRTPQRLSELDAWSQPDAQSRLAALLAASAQGLSLQRCAGAEGRDAASLPPLPEGSLRAVDAGTGEWALGAQHCAAVRDAVLSALRIFHTQRPDELGPDTGRLRRLAAPRLPEPLWRALLARLVAEGAVALRGAFVHLPEHGLRLSSADQRIAQKIAPMLAAAGFEGSWARDLARDGGESEALMRTTLARLASGGELHQVVKDLFYSAACMSQLAALARRVAAAHGGEVTAGTFRDATGLGRKRAIQLLEYFDHIGLLRRVGDVHRLRSDSTLFKEEAA